MKVFMGKRTGNKSVPYCRLEGAKMKNKIFCGLVSRYMFHYIYKFIYKSNIFINLNLFINV